MTRIIAGAAGGRRLATPPGAGTRPTSDRVREAIFSRLEHLEVIEGARVLDLYAGSGALGLEALSRGAGHVVLVDSARKAAEIARRNARDVAAARPGAGRAADLVEVRAEPVARYLRAPAPADVDLAFLDPPYDLSEDELAQMLVLLCARLAPEAVVVVERSARSPEPRWPHRADEPNPTVSDVAEQGPTLAPVADRSYGETRVWFAEFA
ncbi:16S rRNA (guanine966-N2)-methyltransferase [Kineosphaera limosa]|uniref:Methyltransferase n=1 Tax=Kineosphaera limosa NBRC 100340 TaxID=1184609 RepID=K6WFD5_9MICO|nr:16S rRNA (guanine(966)-N(2))-methyltransferase RsmD [Kineosphaera limosa]NYD99475.1 16S rRNA (guanine966-N2)-methyltransferase [Kineosphaera limosa]GAB98010.1 hypothetical protein KILIM_094_00100 [Kineosphaera limosa NBRC 100340]